jgi:hypothetical protein
MGNTLFMEDYDREKALSDSVGLLVDTNVRLEVYGIGG